jgi:hypothetical protein
VEIALMSAVVIRFATLTHRNDPRAICALRFKS